MTAIDFPRPLPRALSLLLAVAAVSLCAGCSSLDGLLGGPHTTSLASSAQDGRPVQEGQTPAEKVVRLPLTAAELDCPPVEIDEGGASARVGGADNASVRYQFDIGQTARECAPVATNQFTLKVGVSGRLVIGPAGEPGAYSAPLRVIVRDQVLKKDAFSKVYKIEATSSGTDGAPFTFVSEPIVLPMTRTDLADDYTLTVGFESGKPAPPPPKAQAAPGEGPCPGQNPRSRLTKPGASGLFGHVSRRHPAEESGAFCLRRRRRNRPGNAQADGPLGDDALESGRRRFCVSPPTGVTADSRREISQVTRQRGRRRRIAFERAPRPRVRLRPG